MRSNVSISTNGLGLNFERESESRSVTERMAETITSSLRTGGETNDVPGWREFTRHVAGFTNFAPHQESMWEWADEVTREDPHVPFVGIWSRDHGKSSTAQAIIAYLAAKDLVSYAVYVTGTQKQADKHIGEIEDLLTSRYVQNRFPSLASPKVNRVGQVRGWRRDRLTTESGLVIEGFGLDASFRGAKIEQQRTDLIVLDDLDEQYDSPEVTEKKENKIRNKVLAAGTSNTKVLAVQNLIKENGIFDRIQKRDAEYLANARVSGPIPAVRNLSYERVTTDDGFEYKITGGEPTWGRMGVEACETLLNRIGPSAFLRECQHEVKDVGGGIFDGLEYRHVTHGEVFEQTDIVRSVVAVDPAITSQDGSDCHAIQVDGLGADDIVYRFFSREKIMTPEQSLRLALRKAVEYGADRVVVETDQGGEAWKSVYRRAWDHLVSSDDYPQIGPNTHRPSYREEKAARTQKSKTARGQEMLHDYEKGQIVHVTGTHLVLERALNRAFVSKPFDLADASFWSWNDLRNRSGGKAYDIN